jgi:hypothetical protein
MINQEFQEIGIPYRPKIFRQNVDGYAQARNIDRNNVDMDEFDLSLVNPHLLNLAVKELQCKDIAGVVFGLDQGDRMAFVFDNVAPLLLFGLYEVALNRAYASCHTNFHRWDMQTLKFMFDVCDRDALYKTGDEFEGEYPLTVYRGICGDGDAYRPRGLSWTDDLEKAKWFAKFPEERYKTKFPNCHVYRVRIKKKDVYFYTNDRQEREFICDIKAKHRPELVWSDE